MPVCPFWLVAHPRRIHLCHRHHHLPRTIPSLIFSIDYRLRITLIVISYGFHITFNIPFPAGFDLLLALLFFAGVMGFLLFLGRSSWKIGIYLIKHQMLDIKLNLHTSLWSLAKSETSSSSSSSDTSSSSLSESLRLREAAPRPLPLRPADAGAAGRPRLPTEPRLRFGTWGFSYFFLYRSLGHTFIIHTSLSASETSDSSSSSESEFLLRLLRAGRPRPPRLGTLRPAAPAPPPRPPSESELAEGLYYKQNDKWAKLCAWFLGEGYLHLSPTRSHHFVSFWELQLSARYRQSWRNLHRRTFLKFKT